MGPCREWHNYCKRPRLPSCSKRISNTTFLRGTTTASSAIEYTNVLETLRSLFTFKPPFWHAHHLSNVRRNKQILRKCENPCAADRDIWIERRNAIRYASVFKSDWAKRLKVVRRGRLFRFCIFIVFSPDSLRMGISLSLRGERNNK